MDIPMEKRNIKKTDMDIPTEKRNIKKDMDIPMKINQKDI